MATATLPPSLPKSPPLSEEDEVGDDDTDVLHGRITEEEFIEIEHAAEPMGEGVEQSVRVTRPTTQEQAPDKKSLKTDVDVDVDVVPEPAALAPVAIDEPEPVEPEPPPPEKEEEEREGETPQERVARQKRATGKELIELQQAALPTEGDGAQIEPLVRRVWKEFMLRQASLKNDITLELGGMKASIFHPVAIVIAGIVDTVGAIAGLIPIVNGILSILQAIVYVITIIVYIVRMSSVVMIAVKLSGERAMRRVKRLALRQFLRLVRRLLMTVIEIIPFLNALPMWTGTQGLEWAEQERDKAKMGELLEDVDRLGKLGKRAQHKKMPPFMRFQRANKFLGLVKKLESRYDRL